MLDLELVVVLLGGLGGRFAWITSWGPPPWRWWPNRNTQPRATILRRSSARQRSAQRPSRDCDGITMPEARPCTPGSTQRRRARVSLSILGVSCRRDQFRPSLRRRSLSVDLNGCPDMLRFRGKGGPFLTSVSSSNHGSSCCTTETAACLAIHSDRLSS